MKTTVLVLAVLLGLRSVSICAPSTSNPEMRTVASEMATAADNFIATLSPEQVAKAEYEINDPQRFDWHFIPRERKGLPIKEMQSEQRLLAYALLSTALSHRGYLKASTIMSLEQVLRDLEHGTGPVRDPERYFFTIFGKPTAKGAWGWRVEGHHLSLNFLIVDGSQISVTPSFMGSNPGEVVDGQRKNLRVLGVEEDLAREFMRSLTDDQKRLAIYTNQSPREIITGNDRKVTALAPVGISAAKLDKSQKELLWQLIKEYVGRYRPEIADDDLNKISKAGRNRITFAWAGGLEPGQGHYYRVQGPTFLLEFDNTQNNANHIHAVWRDFEHDFGEDLLREHYDLVPHPH